MERLFVFIPDSGEYIEINEGDGSNLWDADIEDGAVDYFICTAYMVSFDEYGELKLSERYGAQVLLPKMYSSYGKAEIVSKALDMLGYVASDIPFEEFSPVSC